MYQVIQQIVNQYYRLEHAEAEQAEGGWSALAFHVSAHDRHYFLKAYEKNRASTAGLVKRMDDYLPITVWLYQHTALQEAMIMPIMTVEGKYSCQDAQHVYLLYPLIEGETIGSRELTSLEINQFSWFVRELHRYGQDIPVQTAALKEDFHVPFVNLYSDLFNGNLSEEVQQLVQPYLSSLCELFTKVTQLAELLKEKPPKLVLCHTDLHYWNLMQKNGRLIVIDWEGMKLAPVEADLFALVNKPYFSTFLKQYQEVHSEYQVNAVSLSFYQGRRKLEDSAECIEQLLYDQMTVKEREEVKRDLLGELKGI